VDPARWAPGKDQGKLPTTLPVVGVAGRIPLPAVKDKGELVSYVHGTVTAPEALKTRLQLGSGARLRVWLNGKLVYAARPNNGAAEPDQAGVEVELRPGENRLLVEAAYQGDGQALHARFLDPDRRLTYPEPPGK
jgi:hypothetical protein